MHHTGDMKTGDQVVKYINTRKIHSRHIISQPFTKQAEKGIVLLENDGILPLKENAQKILITGFNADNKLAYLGNYFGDPSHFVMVTEAISQYNIDTEFIRGIHLYNQSTKHDKETALKSAAESDIIIMCTGQT